MSAGAWIVWALGVAAIAGAAPSDVAAADAKSGQALAEKWCVGCHLIGGNGQAAATDAAPSFRLIANRPSTTEDGLRAYLAEPHKSAMRGIVLPRLEIADLAAYIASLREP